MGGGWPEQVPAIAGDVAEHCDPAVGLGSGLRHDLYFVVDQTGERGVEVVDPQEEPDPSCCLIPDRSALPFAVGLGEEETGATADRSHHDPPLRLPVIRFRRLVGDEREAGLERSMQLSCVHISSCSDFPSTSVRQR